MQDREGGMDNGFGMWRAFTWGPAIRSSFVPGAITATDCLQSQTD